MTISSDPKLGKEHITEKVPHWEKKDERKDLSD